MKGAEPGIATLGDIMSTASNKRPELDHSGLIMLTVQACQTAQAAASAVARAVTSGAPEVLDIVKEREEELDTLDREINEGVTALITQVPPQQARELLTCLKLIIELERIGDLLLGFANRLRSCVTRLDSQDVRDLSTMATTLERMVHDAEQAFHKRDTNLAIAILRADGEMDRLRNLVFVRHIENPEGERRQESFHVVFMSQALERAGDHVKNVAEEVVHLVTGRSVRHLLRAADKPFENMFVEYMRRRDAIRR